MKPRDWQCRLYVSLVAYAPRWVVRRVPLRWRRRQLGKLIDLIFNEDRR